MGKGGAQLGKAVKGKSKDKKDKKLKLKESVQNVQLDTDLKQLEVLIHDHDAAMDSYSLESRVYSLSLLQFCYRSIVILLVNAFMSCLLALDGVVCLIAIVCNDRQ